MTEWSEDHVAAIGSLNSTLDYFDSSLLNWRPGRDLGWKVETAGWEGRGVVRGKPAPPRL
jgi:hypothetical protein